MEKTINFKEVIHVIYDHKWKTGQEWADNIHKLADLTDTEITNFERLVWHQGDQQEIARTSFSPWLPVMALFESLSEWQERMRQRRQLMMLDARALADIGISRADAEAEYSKFPWRP